MLLEQLTTSPWNNMLFMMYFGLVVEGILISCQVSLIVCVGKIIISHYFVKNADLTTKNTVFTSSLNNKNRIKSGTLKSFSTSKCTKTRIFHNNNIQLNWHLIQHSRKDEPSIYVRPLQIRITSMLWLSWKIVSLDSICFNDNNDFWVIF